MLSTRKGKSAYAVASTIEPPTCASTSAGNRNYRRLAIGVEES